MEELTGDHLDRFMDGFEAAECDWNKSQLYASYMPTSDDGFKDGYAFFVRFCKHYTGTPTWH